MPVESIGGLLEFMESIWELAQHPSPLAPDIVEQSHPREKCGNSTCPKTHGWGAHDQGVGRPNPFTANV